MALRITPTKATLGALVHGIDLARLDDETFATIEAAWHDFGILIFPEQNLSEAAHVAFSRRFGTLERNVTANDVGDNPEVVVLSNVMDGGGLWAPDSDHGLFLKGNCYWHTDSSFKRVPAKGSILAARIVPNVGGETEYADMRAAYDALAPGMHEFLRGKAAVHSYAYSQGLIGGMGALSQDEWDAVPPVEHPLIRAHPATGRRSLYIGRHASHIAGEDVEESRGLPVRPVGRRASTNTVGVPVTCCVLHRGYAPAWSAAAANESATKQPGLRSARMGVDGSRCGEVMGSSAFREDTECGRLAARTAG